LSTADIFLQQESLEPNQKETTVAIDQKIKGTELISLLENSIDGALQKIAELLDGTLTITTQSGSSFLQNDLDRFYIGEFV
jgi:hypothetical protein